MRSLGIVQLKLSNLVCDQCRYIGVYFAQISSEGVCEAVESADAYLLLGPTFNDYSTCAFSTLLSDSKMVAVDPRRVKVGGKRTFGCVNMAEFLPALAKELKPNDKVWHSWKRTYLGPGKVPSAGENEPIKGRILYEHLQARQTSSHLVCSSHCRHHHSLHTVQAHMCGQSLARHRD